MTRLGNGNRNTSCTRWPIWLFCSATLVAALATPITAEVIQRPIIIDGDLRDWGPVLVSSANFIGDRSIEQGDPDTPASSDRDLRAFAVTWDATNLYFYFRRTFGGNNSVTFLVYIDLDHNGTLAGNDVILRYDFNGSTARERLLYLYVPTTIADPITGDGVNEPGQVGTLLPATMDSASHSSGLEVEGSIAWASLGLPASSPLTFHASAASGISLPGHLRDNTDPIDTQYSVVGLDQDCFAAGPSPSTLQFPHRVSNGGNGADIFDLSARSAQGWAISLWTDPNGDGDPSDGELLAVDENGDGDFGDPLDSPPAASKDTNDDGLPDTGLLSPVTPAPPLPAPPSEYFFVVELAVPAGVPTGGDDTVTVVARSDRALAEVAINFDTAAIGDRIIAPDRYRGGVPGDEVWYPHLVCNFGATDDVIDLTATSALGWSAAIWSDPNGDGDPTDGAPLTDTDSDLLVDNGTQVPGTCIDIVTRVSVPSGAAVGTIDTITNGATSSVGLETDVAIDVVEVVGATMVEPDRARIAIPGELLYSPHSATNGGLVGDTLDLVPSSLLGSSVGFWSDPSCNGLVDDGGPISTIGELGAFGGTSCLLTEIAIASNFVVGSTEIATTNGISQTTALSDSAADTVDVHFIRTYATPLLTFPADTFLRCGTAYVGAAGLSSGGEYRFVWGDPNSIDGPERISSSVSPDSVGRVDDRYATLLTDTVGTWTVRLQVRSGSDWIDVVPFGSFSFEVAAEDSGLGIIDELASDRLAYEITADTIRVRSEVANDSPVFFYRDSTLTYVLFLDADLDGRPTAGESYIQANGSMASWLDGLVTHESVNVTIHPFERLFHSWSVTNVQFPAADIWSIQMTWETPCGTSVDESLINLIVGCAVQPLVDAGADAAYCPLGSAAIGSPAEPRRTYAWTPTTGLDDATVAQPTATVAATTTYILTVTDVDTACSITDTVDVVVHPRITPAISPSSPRTCTDQAITLDAGAGFLDYLWSTGETTQTITVSPATDMVYTVSVTDSNGCSDGTITTVVVNPPPAADAGPDWTTCPGQRVTIGLPAVPGFTYAWSPAAAFVDPTAAQPTTTPTATTTYTVTITDTATGCSSDDVVTVFADPPTPTAPLGNVLREVRSGDDVIHYWTDSATDTVYELRISSTKDLSGMTMFDGATPGVEQVTEIGAVPTSPMAFYDVRGLGCTPNSAP